MKKKVFEITFVVDLPTQSVFEVTKFVVAKDFEAAWEIVKAMWKSGKIDLLKAHCIGWATE
jgi:DNA polymerase III delta subunit